MVAARRLGSLRCRRAVEYHTYLARNIGFNIRNHINAAHRDGALYPGIGAYNCRLIDGSTSWSVHLGAAVDTNWQRNPRYQIIGTAADSTARTTARTSPTSGEAGSRGIASSGGSTGTRRPTPCTSSTSPTTESFGRRRQAMVRKLVIGLTAMIAVGAGPVSGQNAATRPLGRGNRARRDAGYPELRSRRGVRPRDGSRCLGVAGAPSSRRRRAGPCPPGSRGRDDPARGDRTRARHRLRRRSSRRRRGRGEHACTRAASPCTPKRRTRRGLPTAISPGRAGAWPSCLTTAGASSGSTGRSPAARSSLRCSSRRPGWLWRSLLGRLTAPPKAAGTTISGSPVSTAVGGDGSHRSGRAATAATIRTPVVVDGTLSFVRGHGRGSGNGRATVRALADRTGDRAPSATAAQGARYLAGVRRGDLVWNVPDPEHNRFPLTVAGRTIGCGAVMADPPRRGRPRSTFQPWHVPLGVTTTRRADAGSHRRSRGHRRRLHDHRRGRGRRRVDQGRVPDSRVDVVDPSVAPLAIRPGVYGALLHLPVDADPTAALAAFRERLPGYSANSWIVTP